MARKYVAVKVCTANANPREVDIISTLTHPSSPPASHPGRMMLPSILDRFTLNGLNGNHACYVTAPVSASLSDLKDGSWIRLFQPDVARSLAAQLMLALDYVHAQGIVHGDMYLGNILLKVPLNFDQLSPERLHEKYGAPELEPVSRLNGKPLPPGVPTHGVPPIWLGKASEEIVLLETRILLADFGEAFILFILSKERKFESCTPLVIRPPEARFEPNEPLSFSSDIWTLTCTIWTIIGQRQLLEGFLATEDDMTCEHVCQDTLSILPLDWWEKWDALRQKFDGDGEPRNRKSFRSWDDRFEDSVQQPRQDSGISPFNEKEEALFNVLRLMLSFRPANRPTTNQILKSEWMVKLALPEYRKSQNNI